MNPYLGYKVYGPYIRKDGRQHVVLVAGKHHKTVSYPKYLMEISLDRLLASHETIHHKDGDFTNDCLDNLEVIDRATHAAHHAMKYDIKLFVCPVCDKQFILDGLQQARLKAERKRGRSKTGPFCSRNCSGKVNH
jgi:hypothetical protein